MNAPFPLFRAIPVPAAAVGNGIGEHARWMTWSEPAADWIARFAREADALPEPNLVKLPRGSEFSRTYSLPVDQLRRLKCFEGLEAVARSLRCLQIGEKLTLLDAVFGGAFSGDRFRKFFAAIREVVVMQKGHGEAALYAPLGYVGPRADDFPLHADLYVPNILWNVFEDVPADGSGASTFLPTAVFRELLEKEKVPGAAAKILRSCLDDESTEDRFRVFYNLLHVDAAEWTERLNRAMVERQQRIALGPGQGYLIDDRQWLHGREAPTGGVTTKRVHRLVFTTG